MKDFSKNLCSFFKALYFKFQLLVSNCQSVYSKVIILLLFLLPPRFELAEKKRIVQTSAERQLE